MSPNTRNRLNVRVIEGTIMQTNYSCRGDYNANIVRYYNLLN